jgi:GNAT superfamily N-acetyltransferase
MQLSKQDFLKIIDLRDKSWLATYPCIENITFHDVVITLTKKSLCPDNLNQIYQNYSKGTDKWEVIKTEEILGFIHWKQEKDYLNLIELYVDPAYFGNGVGSQLLELLPHKKIISAVAQDTKAVDFYKKKGFIVTGESNKKINGKAIKLLTVEKNV